jgi:hypothetical protein
MPSLNVARRAKPYKNNPAVSPKPPHFAIRGQPALPGRRRFVTKSQIDVSFSALGTLLFWRIAVLALRLGIRHVDPLAYVSWLSQEIRGWFGRWHEIPI